MSDATLDLLTSADFLTALFIGSIAVLTAAIWAAAVARPAPIGGLLLSGGIVVALLATQRVPPELILGLLLLAAAGWAPRPNLVAGMAAAIPGATAVGAAFLDSPRPGVVVFVVVAIVLAAPLIADFDENHRTTGLSMPLMAIAVVSVFITVPDTDEAIVAAGVAVPAILAGPPARLARLGGPGAFAGAGILIWVVASGGIPRPGSLIAGAASLGLLLIEPVARRLWTARQAGSDRSPGSAALRAIAVVAVQVAIGLAMSQVARVAGSNALLAATLAAPVLLTVGVWVRTQLASG